ncbi:unnamed protein product [Sphenostylis stenocarpa]|uniref:Uncharacterized protein n=1 Tax=Sphenostylis stenocarpa TaxID=92480 RepID=A0AA86V776_9FABA|nr:unnamed protein product [Sphenostylis stenocarpa]
MHQLEAEHEFELQKFPGIVSTELVCSVGIRIESETMSVAGRTGGKPDCGIEIRTIPGTGHETEAHKGTTNWDYNTLESESEQPVGGVKTLTDCEPRLD